MGYRKQHGFTLAELLVALAILGVLSTAVAMTIGVVMKTSAIAMDQNSELSQVHMAGSWISRDVKNAEVGTVVVLDPSIGLCEMQCYVWKDGQFVSEKVKYWIDDAGELKRESWPLDAPALAKTITVARFIDAAGTDFISEGSTLTYYKLTVTAKAMDSGVTRIYKIMEGYNGE